jgi:hypothetical protein
MMLLEQTVRLLDQVSRQGDRSRLIDQAVQDCLSSRRRAQLKKWLREGVEARAELDLTIAATVRCHHFRPHHRAGRNALVHVVELASPIESFDSRNRIEVAVPAYQGKIMLPAEGRNPKIIRRNRLFGPSQLNVDRCVVMGGLLGDVQHSAISDQIIQPAPIPTIVAGLGDSIAIFPDHHNWECKLPGTSQNPDDPRVFLCSSGKCICV